MLHTKEQSFEVHYNIESKFVKESFIIASVAISNLANASDYNLQFLLMLKKIKVQN